MDLDVLANNEWIRAAMRAHMVLSQALSDEDLDDLRLSRHDLEHPAAVRLEAA